MAGCMRQAQDTVKEAKYVNNCWRTMKGLFKCTSPQHELLEGSISPGVFWFVQFLRNATELSLSDACCGFKLSRQLMLAGYLCSSAAFHASCQLDNGS